MKSFQVARANLSPYQSENFGLQEKNALEAFPGLRYLPLKDLDPEDETILITNTHTQFKNLDPQILKKTKLILHPNSGYDHWLEEKNFWNDIPVVVGHTIRAQAVAEYTLGCLFDSFLQLPQHLSWDSNRKWDRRLLKDSEIWVFGYGHIGKIVADTLNTLGAKVTVVDPYLDSCPHP